MSSNRKYSAKNQGSKSANEQNKTENVDNETLKLEKASDDFKQKYHGRLVPSKITVTNFFGLDMMVAFKESLPDVEIDFKQSTRFKHSSLAYLRKLYDTTVRFSNHAYQFISFGDHVRTALTIDPTMAEIGHPGYLSDRTWSLCPILDPRDQKRAFDWKQQLWNAGRDWETMCRCTAGFDHRVCPHVEKWVKNRTKPIALNSTDSIYYPGVIQCMAAVLIKNYQEVKRSWSLDDPSLWESDKELNMIPAHIIFHDLKSAYVNKRSKMFDDQGTVTFTDEGGFVVAEHRVEGNPDLYRHRILNTPEGATVWQINAALLIDACDFSIPEEMLSPEEGVEENMGLARPTRSARDRLRDKWSKFWVLFEEKLSCNVGTHKYRYVTMQIFDQKFSQQDDFPTMDSFYVKASPRVEATIDISKKVYEVVDPVKGMAFSIIGRLLEKQVVAKYNEADQTISMRIPQKRILKLLCWEVNTNSKQQFVAPASLVNSMLVAVGGATELKIIKKRLDSYIADQISNQKQQFKPVDMTKLRDASVIAMTWSADFSLSVVDVMLHNPIIDKLKERLSGVKRIATMPWWFHFIIGLITLLILKIGIDGVSRLAVRAAWEGPFYQQEDFSWMIVVLLSAIYAYIQTKKARIEAAYGTDENPEFLWETSVTVPARLEFGKKSGYDPEFKIKGDWVVPQGSLATKLDFLDVKDPKIGAHRVAPLLRGERFVTPTIKSSDKACKIASAISATDLNMELDPRLSKRFHGFLKRMMADLEYHLRYELNGYEFCWDEFKARYEPSYQAKLEEHKENYFNKPKPREDVFCKKEKQYTTVDHDEKDTEKNDVKERQIVSSQYLLCNIIYEKETELVKEFFYQRYGYHVLAPSLDISEMGPFLYETFSDVPNPQYLEADGSRFDKCCHRLYDKEIKMALIGGVSDSIFPEPITHDYIEKAILGDDISRVQLCNDFKYKVKGRRSGEGCTYLANSILMAVIWLYISKEAKVPKDNFRFTVRGDDMIAVVSRQYTKQINGVIKAQFVDKDQANGLVGFIFKKVFHHDSIEDASFISLNFIDEGSTWRAVRILGRVNQFTPWSTQLDKVAKKDFDQARSMLTFMMGCSLLSWASNLPIYRELALQLISLGKKCSLDEVRNLRLIREREMRAKGESTETLFQKKDSFNADKYLEGWEWLRRRFDATDDEIADCIKQVRNVSSIHQVIYSPLFDRMI